MDSMTRTHWLLVILIGLLVWGFGWTADVAAVEFIGFVVTVAAVVTMLATGKGRA